MTTTHTQLLRLIKQEINDAKIKAFDKLLFYIMSENSTEVIMSNIDTKVVHAYDEYKNDIARILKIYSANALTSDGSMKKFVEELEKLDT